MHTIVESPLFNKIWPEYWPEEDRGNLPHFSRSIPAPVMLSLVLAVFPKFAGLKKALVNTVGLGCCM